MGSKKQDFLKSFTDANHLEMERNQGGLECDMKEETDLHDYCLGAERDL